MIRKFPNYQLDIYGAKSHLNLLGWVWVPLVVAQALISTKNWSYGSLSRNPNLCREKETDNGARGRGIVQVPEEEETSTEMHLDGK